MKIFSVMSILLAVVCVQAEKVWDFSTNDPANRAFSVHWANRIKDRKVIDGALHGTTLGHPAYFSPVEVNLPLAEASTLVIEMMAKPGADRLLVYGNVSDPSQSSVFLKLNTDGKFHIYTVDFTKMPKIQKANVLKNFRINPDTSAKGAEFAIKSIRLTGSKAAAKETFPGEKISQYNGYKMYSFKYDGKNCIVVEPKKPRADKRWVWKAEFFRAFPKFELEMLNRGYYLAFMSVGNTFGHPSAMKHFDNFYKFLTEKHGFYNRPILLGLSRGGLYIYNWACKNPDSVGCVYADNPVCDFKSWPAGMGKSRRSKSNWEKLMKLYGFKSEAEAFKYPQPLDNVKILVDKKIPLVHAARMQDRTVPIAENTDLMEKRVLELGGKIKVFRHPGDHHPHGLDDPKPMADWIEANAL